MSKISSIFISLLLLSFSLNAQWISVDKNKSSYTEPSIQLLSDNISSSVIKIELAGFEMNQFTSDGKTYDNINILSESVTTEAGSPEIPHLTALIAVPDQAGISVEIVESGDTRIFENVYLPPARESWIEGEPETPYIENSKVYMADKVYPASLADIDQPIIYRDFRIVRLSIYPIRYNPGKAELQVVPSITVKLNYNLGFAENQKKSPKRPISPSYGQIYRSSILNYESVLEREFDGREEGHDLMLCIMDDLYYEEFLPYAEWKRKSGIDIHITKFSDIGANASNYQIIKDHISNAYFTWEVPPTYILFVGDAGFFPYTFSGSYVSENWFVELEGNDAFPECLLGRFTNQGEYRLQVMVNKFEMYERTPYMDDISWYKKGIICSNNAYISQKITKRFARATMLEYGHFDQVDTMLNATPCPGNVNDIINIVNEGRSFLNYRGEGWSSGWWASCIPFGTSDVNNLNNGQKFTFVTSIGCGVAMFNSSGGNCFGETWVQLGTIEEPRGACAFIGPTGNTHTTYNNKIDMGIYMGMFMEGLETTGQGLDRGRLYLYEVYGTNSYVPYHFRIYCILGDPSMHIWKNVPEEVTVSQPISVPLGYSQSEIIVTNSLTGLPVYNAQVCFSGNEIFATGTTDINGRVYMEIESTEEDTLDIVVRGMTVYPYESTIEIVSGNENIAPANDPVVVDIDGNMDGLINPNENCQITYTLKNWGVVTSQNVQAVLFSEDTALVEIITTDPVDFGNLDPNESFTGSPFQFYIKPACPVGAEITLELAVTSSSSSWTYYDVEEVHGCILDFAEEYIDDEGQVLHNFRMDPGETVNVSMKILNIGDDFAPNTTGILRSSNQFITIVDSIGTFDNILADSSAINTADYFVVTIDPACSTQYLPEYSLELLTQGGLYPYNIIRTITIPVAMPSVYDPTGPDEYGYYAYSSDDILFEQSPVYNWVEINGIGTEIPRSPGVSNFTQTVNLPFSFKHYGNNFNQVRISSDGWIALGSGTQTAFTNQSLPCLDDINNMIAAFWDDLFSTDPAETGKLLYYYDISSNRFLVEWYNVGHLSDVNDKETFQIILLDPVYYPTSTGDGEILFQYNDVEEAGSCTIGIENDDETVGLDYLFNEFYDETASEIGPGFAIKFTTDEPLIVSIGDDDGKNNNILPDKYSLEQNYPNPFNPSTRIKYSIPEPGFVTLRIYNINGQLIKTVQEGMQLAGRYEKIWNGRNENGGKVSSGVYFYRIQVNSFNQTKKLILLK